MLRHKLLGSVIIAARNGWDKTHEEVQKLEGRVTNFNSEQNKQRLWWIRFFVEGNVVRFRKQAGCVRNVIAHAQKPDFVFPRNGRVHLNQQGASVQSTAGSRGVGISGSNAGYTMFRGSVKSTGYPLHSSVSLSFPLSCVTVCHHISTEVYLKVKLCVCVCVCVLP